MTVANHHEDEYEFSEGPAMRRSRPRIFPRWVMVALAIVAAVACLWSIRFPILDDEAIAFCLIGIFFLGLPALGLFVLLVVIAKVTPSDPPPRQSSTIERPQFTIGCLTTVVAIAAVVLMIALYAN